MNWYFSFSLNGHVPQFLNGNATEIVALKMRTRFFLILHNFNESYLMFINLVDFSVYQRKRRREEYVKNRIFPLCHFECGILRNHVRVPFFYYVPTTINEAPKIPKR